MSGLRPTFIAMSLMVMTGAALPRDLQRDHRAENLCRLQAAGHVAASAGPASVRVERPIPVVLMRASVSGPVAAIRVHVLEPVPHAHAAAYWCYTDAEATSVIRFSRSLLD